MIVQLPISKRIYYPSSDTIKQYDFYIDTVKYKDYFYTIDNLILENHYSPFSDTISNLTFSIHEKENGKSCKLYINYIQLSEEISFSDWKDLKYVQKQYKNIIEWTIISPLKE